MRNLDPQQLAEDVVAESLGGCKIELGDTTMVVIAQRAMIAALEWALGHDSGNCDWDKIEDQIARLKVDTS